ISKDIFTTSKDIFPRQFFISCSCSLSRFCHKHSVSIQQSFIITNNLHDGSRYHSVAWQPSHGTPPQESLAPMNYTRRDLTVPSTCLRRSLTVVTGMVIGYSREANFQLTRPVVQ
ncbi:hypothetical protein BaRGS_00040532, partial [Batillaria attramentaria]